MISVPIDPDHGQVRLLLHEPGDLVTHQRVGVVNQRLQNFVLDEEGALQLQQLGARHAQPQQHVGVVLARAESIRCIRKLLDHIIMRAVGWTE